MAMAHVRTASQMEVSSGRSLVTSRTTGWYTQQTNSILQGLHEEINKDCLEELKIYLQELNLDREMISRVIDAKNFIQLLEQLMEHTNNNIHEVVVALATYVPMVICDMKPEVRDKLLWLSRTAIREINNTESVIYGRDESLNKLMSLVSFEDNLDVRLVNVCGMPGIGKSFLVKHLRCRLANVFYVDASGAETLDALKVEIIKQSHIPAVFTSSQDLMGAFLDFLLQNKNDSFVLILDDLSSLMDGENKSCRPSSVLEFLNDVMLKMRQSGVQLKMVVTSQVYLQMTSESKENSLLVGIKNKMKPYTKDLPLTRLPEEEALKFLGPSLQELNETLKKRLVKLCDGHPLALNLMSELTTADFTHTTEISQISPADVEEEINGKLFDVLFERAFNKLTELNDQNKMLLYAVVFFDLGAPLRALHYMLNSEESFKEFTFQLTKNFSNNFWLRIHTVPIKGCTMVFTHHPLIRKFLLKRMSSCEDDQSLKLALKRRYIVFHITKLVNIGKECVPEPPVKHDFVQQTCSKFLRDQINFKKVFFYLQDLADPCILFSKDADSVTLCKPTEIAHLFLCLCQFHDWFNGTLVTTLSEMMYRSAELMHSSTNYTAHHVLIQTLYGVILAEGKNWTELADFLGPYNKIIDPSRIIAVNRDLFFLCKAMHSYIVGALYVHQSRVKEVDVEKLTGKHEEFLSDALKKLNLKLPSSDWKRVRVYFSIQVSLLMAEGVVSRNRDNANASALQSAYEICHHAKEKFISQASILEPSLYSAMAYYKSEEGHLHKTDPPAAGVLYHQAASFFKNVSDQLRSRRMDNGVTAARNYDKYAVLMRCWGFILVKSAADEKSEEATNMFIIAKEIGAKALSIWESKSFCCSSMEDVCNAYMNQAFVFTNLARYHHKRSQGRMADREKHGYQMNALRYCGLAYGLLKDDYRKCHLVADDKKLKHLALQLPHFMKVAQHPSESIDKVKFNLQEIQNEVRRGAHEPLNLSGSEVYASNSDDYDDSSPDDVECEETTTGSALTSTATVRQYPPAYQAAVHFNTMEIAQTNKKRKL